MTTKLTDIGKNLERQPFTYSASTLAILASIGLGGAGVWRMVAPGVEAAEPMAYIGAGVAFAAIAVSEMTAAVTLLHADRRDAQDAGARKWVARGVFAAAILANMLAGHQGAGAISDALIGPQREPAERRLASAASAERIAEDAAVRFDDMTRVLMATYDADLDAARAGAAMAVTARRGTMSDKQDAAQNREQLRARTVARELAGAEAETAAAQAALANAPKPLSDLMRWAMAMMFELVKSVLIWVATPRTQRPAGRPKAQKAPGAAPIVTPSSGGYGLEVFAARGGFLKRRPVTDFNAIAQRATREMVRGLDAAARKALGSEAKRIAAWCQHAAVA